MQLTACGLANQLDCMRIEGLEPPRSNHQNLNLTCLPVSSYPLRSLRYHATKWIQLRCCMQQSGFSFAACGLADQFYCRRPFRADQLYCKNSRIQGGRIRTYGFLLPKQTRYLAALHPVKVCNTIPRGDCSAIADLIGIESVLLQKILDAVKRICSAA